MQTKLQLHTISPCDEIAIKYPLRIYTAQGTHSACGESRRCVLYLVLLIL